MRLTLGAIGIVLGALVIAACDKVVYREPLQSYEVNSNVSCTYAGYCYSCFGMNGKLECGFKFSAMCGGTQPARLRVTPVKVGYESGATVTDYEHTVLERTGECR